MQFFFFPDSTLITFFKKISASVFKECNKKRDIQLFKNRIYFANKFHNEAVIAFISLTIISLIAFSKVTLKTKKKPVYLMRR